jgi:D-hydroxyproline dehydrogenase subunit beta
VIRSVEVAVVGAGIVGCATACELARRGVRAALVDRAEVSRGTTGLGEGNVLCSDKGPGPELELAVRGLSLYDEIEALLGESAGIRRKGALVVHSDEDSWSAEPARLERLRVAGVECSTMSPVEVREAEPALRGTLVGASWFPHDLQCARRRSRGRWRGRRSGSARWSRPASRWGRSRLREAACEGSTRRAAGSRPTPL